MDDGVGIIFNLIIGLVFGAISASIASGKGRSAVGWFFGGFFLGLIGLIIVACLSNLKDEEARIARDLEEKRRLREQLKQEQMKSESYRQYTMDRLDAHDEALGIDTKDTQIALPAGAEAARPKLLTPGTAVVEDPPAMDAKSVSEISETYEDHEWFYSNNSEDRLGPFGFKELQQLYAAKEINDQTLVWSQALSDWTAAGELAEIKNPSV